MAHARTSRKRDGRRDMARAPRSPSRSARAPVARACATRVVHAAALSSGPWAGHLAVRACDGNGRALAMRSPRREKIWAVVRVASGNFLEMYDFFVFGYYAAAIGRVFFP